MSKRPQESEYTEAEAQTRFQEALKAGLSTEPKPLKDKPKVRGPNKKAKAKAKKAR
jgi:hypothetical protein